MKINAIKKIILLIVNTGLTKVLGILTHFIVAGYLSKQDFGIYAIFVVVFSISEGLKNGGAHQYLMHHCDQLKKIENDVYYLGLLFNSFLMLSLVLLSNSIADFYQAKILKDLLYLLAASIPYIPPGLSIKLNC